MWLLLKKIKLLRISCGFVREQVEEEATAQGIVDKIKKAGDTGIFFVDSQWDNADNDLKIENYA